MNTAFEAEPPSSPVQPDAGKREFLAVSLLYTERVEGEVPERPLTAREVAQALGIGVDGVRRLCRRGAIEHFRVSNAIRVSREELERFIREHRNRPLLEVQKSVRAGRGILRLLLDRGQEEADPTGPSTCLAHGEEEVVVLPAVLLEVRGT